MTTTGFRQMCESLEATILSKPQKIILKLIALNLIAFISLIMKDENL